MSSRGKVVFVTVGTTEFNQLIKTIVSKEVLNVLIAKGFGKVVLQIGRGQFEPSSASSEFKGITIDWYRYKSSIREDLVSADLVISHAGAGTCLETLDVGRPLLVVVNESLQDNHQFELARQLAKDQHLIYCTPQTLCDTLQNSDFRSLKPWLQGQPKVFADWLDRLMTSF